MVFAQRLDRNMSRLIKPVLDGVGKTLAGAGLTANALTLRGLLSARWQRRRLRCTFMGWVWRRLLRRVCVTGLTVRCPPNQAH